MLPVPNRAAVEKSILVGLALGSRIAERSIFYRKNYFYPDSPKAYQISQYDEPLCVGGSLDVLGPDGIETVRFVRAHLEEDAAKTIHAGGGSGRIAGSTGSVVDFNRCGTPLLEIVTEPDLRTPEAARRFLTLLKATIQAIGVSDCDMEKGSLRCDANVSLRRPGEQEFRPKAELKNMNSFRFLERGIEAELRRQAAIYEGGGTITLQTLHYDPQRDELTVLRSKEEADDYRYFPEPDLVPMEPSAELIERLRSELPELPAARSARFVSELGLSQQDADVLNQSPAMAATYFEQLAALAGDAKASANWIMGDLSAYLNEHALPIEESPVEPAALAQLIGLVGDGTLGSAGAKQVFAALAAGEAGETRARSSSSAVSRRSPIRSAARRRRGRRRQPGPGSRVPCGQGRAARVLRRPGHAIDRWACRAARRAGAAARGARRVVLTAARHSIFEEPVRDGTPDADPVDTRPDAGPAAGAGRDGRAAAPSPHERVQGDLRRLAREARSRLPHRARRAHVHGLGHRRLRVGLREPAVRPATGCCASRAATSAIAGSPWRRPTAPR